MKSANYRALITVTCSMLLFFAYTQRAISDDATFAGDTLSHYTFSANVVSYSHPSIRRQAARFAVSLPVKLHEISLWMGGATGTFTVRIWGHEGGSSAPSIEKDMVAPIAVSKTQMGIQKLTIPLGAENISIVNNQFFVVVEDLSPGVQLLSDADEKTPSCVSDKEKFVAQYLQMTDGSWQYGRFGFAIDVVVAHPRKGREDLSFTKKSMPLVPSLKKNEKNTQDIVHSIACADIDNNGYIDVLAGGRLYINEGGSLVDRTEERGIKGKASAHCFLDIDNDGDSDILFLGKSDSITTIPCVLFVNNGGTFHPVLLTMPKLSNPTSFSLADVNQDGYVDIFIGQSIQNPLDNAQNYLFINSTNRSFIDRTGEFLPSIVDREKSTCRGASFVDVNNDKIPDLYIVNYYGRADELWIGRKGGAFLKSTGFEEKVQGGMEHAYEQQSPAWSSSGGHWIDVDGNGVVDLLTARYVAPAYSRLSGSVEGTVWYKLPTVATDIPSVMSSFEYEEKQSSGVWGDIDNDGRVDCMLFTPCKCRYADLYRQTENKTFSLITAEAGLDGLDEVNDGIWLDINNDGLLDMVCIHGDSLVVFENQCRHMNNYVSVDLEGAGTNRNVLGATVVAFAGTHIQTQQVIAGRGLLMQDPARIHYGLGSNSTIDSVVVTWPSGKREHFTDIVPNSVHKLKEGTGSGGTYNQTSFVSVGAQPVPFRDRVNIYFALSKTAHVTVTVFDAHGTLVKNLVSRTLQDGDHTVTWDGQNERGEPVSSGIYLCKCSADGSDVVEKIVKID